MTGSDSVPLTPSAAAGLALASSICLVGPILLAWWWRRRTGVTWLAFGAGALVFFVTQIILRFPWQIPLGRWVQEHREWVIPFLLFSAFTAGVFEEVGRWAGYRYLPRERSRRTGVMLGLGHGGLESILLVGLPLAGLLVGWMMASRGMVAPGATLEAIRRQTALLEFWSVQLATMERASAMALHVGLSLIVLQVWLRGGLHWLSLAILLHFTANALGALLVHGLRMSPLVPELLVAAIAIAILVLGWRLSSNHRS